MFIPLTLERFLEQVQSLHPTWKPNVVFYFAKRPDYRRHLIEKPSRTGKRNILLGADFLVAEKPPEEQASAPENLAGMRILHEPCPALKSVQEHILRVILGPAQAELLPCVHGCVSGRSVVTNAYPHVGARLKIHMDLKDFFPSITTPRVYGLYRKVFQYDNKLSWLLANLTTYEGRLPQGAPTSPMTANLIATPMDRTLTRLIRSMGGRYTRYVDDLTFSFKRRPSLAAIRRLLVTVRWIARNHGFRINKDKTSVIGRKSRMVVTGVVVNDKPSIPVWFRKNLRAALHQRSLDIPTADSLEEIEGKIAYVKMVCPEQADAVLRGAKTS